MEINEHTEWYDMASSVALTMKGINFKNGCVNLLNIVPWPDEVVLYAFVSSTVETPLSSQALDRGQHSKKHRI